MRAVVLAILASAPVCRAEVVAEPTPIPMQDAIVRPRPDYPREARLRHETGRGVLILHVDNRTGRVTSVVIARSTGHKLLDDAAVHAFIRWRYKPGVVPKGLVKMPIAYTMPPKT
jgi:protein TonB